MNFERLTRIRKLQKINKEGSIITVLPKEMLELLDWNVGDKVVVSTDGNSIIIKKEECHGEITK